MRHNITLRTRPDTAIIANMIPKTGPTGKLDEDCSDVDSSSEELVLVGKVGIVRCIRLGDAVDVTVTVETTARVSFAGAAADVTLAR